MRRLFRKSVVGLAMFMCCSLLLGIACKLDWNVANASTGSSGGYTNLTYQELDDITYRDSESTSSAQITVFTHGLGGTPSHWSNQGNPGIEGFGSYKYEYDVTSMPEQLREKMEENGQSVVMFTAKMAINPLLTERIFTQEEIEEKQLDVNKKYQKTSLSEDEWKSGLVSDSTTNEKAGPESHQALYEKYFAEEVEGASNEEVKCTQLVELREQTKEGYILTTDTQNVKQGLTANDVSKHIILIFEAVDPDGSNDYVYAQLEYILDVISYQYLQLTGVLPTYNMVAHSRGGLTNMQYALAHPYNVASLYSVGTPYSGSAFGSAALDAGMDKNHIFLSVAGYSRDDVTYSDGSNFSPGVLDIIDATAIESYKTYWNTNYDSFYSHIDFNPVGSYVTLGFVVQLLIDYVETEGVLDWLGNMKDPAVGVLNNIGLGLECVWGATSILVPDYIYLRVQNSLIDTLKDYVLNYFDNRERVAWLEVLNNFRTISVPYESVRESYAFSPTFVIADDMFIDLNSQIASGYTAADVKVCLMDSIDQIEGRERKNVDMAGVAHNFEVRHPDIVRYIVEDLVGGSSEPYSYRFANGGYYITSMNYDMSTGGVLTLPSTYNGKPVVGIDRIKQDILIGGSQTYYPNITNVIIPSSVKEISEYAFYGMSGLVTVQFDSGSQLNKIGNGAFMNCSSLENFVIPNSVTQIKTNAFSGCESLASFTVGNNNTVFSVEDGVLLSKDKTKLLFYPEGKGTSYTVPMTVTEITPSAFIGNTSLTTIDLNEVKTIRMFAFSGCVNLENITSNNLEIVEYGVFEGTSWLENQTNDEVILGKVLLAYQGNETEVVLENIMSIAPFAFENNETLTSVIFSDGLSHIGTSAFAGCTSLEAVYIGTTDTFVYISNCAFDDNAEDRVIYVPFWDVDAYLENENWKRYKKDISVHKTIINYDSKGGSLLQSEVVYYKESLTLPIPMKTGYTFAWWYMDEAYTQIVVNKQMRWDSLLEEVTLYAKWVPIEYSIVYIVEMDENGRILEYETETYTGDDSVVFYLPSKEGYTFEGWYHDVEYTQPAGTGFAAGRIGRHVLYAKWGAEEYDATYNLNDDERFPASINGTISSIEFGSSDYQIPVPTRMGFSFNGWKVLVNDAYEFYTDETGSANRKWDIANDVILVADWTRHTYYIRIGADETFVWIGEDGISSTETSIEYGSLFDSASNLENNMNIENVSLKEGHKFQYFELSNGVRFEQWSQLAALYENGATVELTAVFEKEKNFIIRYLNGEFPLLVGDYGDPIELEVQEDLPGYKFSHWIVAPISEASGNERFIGTPFAPGEKFDYDTMPDLSYGVEEDLVVLYLQAVQEKIYSQVKLKAIYSKVTPNTVILEYGENFELPVPEPVDGREFLGWCVSEENRGAIAILGIQITDENGQCIAPWQYEEDIVLEAAWHTIAYRIIYDLDGGYFIGGSAERNWYMVDDEFLLSKPIKAGSEFKGWKNVKTGNIMSKIPKGLKGDVRLIAQWSKHCIITFDYR